MFPLFTLDSETKKLQLLTDLSNIVPTNPRLLNKIYSCSSLGSQEKVIATFSNTRSIQRVPTQTWVDEDSLIRQLSTMEKCIVDYNRERSLSTRVQPATFEDIFSEIMELLGWLQGDPNITQLIVTCIEEKTDIPIDVLKRYSRQVYSGTVSHRLTCPSLQRGGMANSNLNFNSWVKIISDTATNFAKKGENHNICFQSVFLHGIQVLNHIHLKLPYQCSKSWGITFSCSGCLWKIGEEKFSLEKTTYEGLHLEKKVTDLRPRAQPKRVSHLRRSKGGSTAYSIMTARKVVQWVKDNDINPFSVSRPAQGGGGCHSQLLELGGAEAPGCTALPRVLCDVPLLVRSFIYVEQADNNGPHS